jgi:uncharacterized protein YegP (UPF0339 family)
MEDIMYFVIDKAVNGQYYFKINAENHETLCHSETYVTKYGAKHAIDLIKNGAADAVTVDLT